jgi:hypothetical protein
MAHGLKILRCSASQIMRRGANAQGFFSRHASRSVDGVGPSAAGVAGARTIHGNAMLVIFCIAGLGPDQSEPGQLNCCESGLV